MKNDLNSLIQLTSVEFTYLDIIINLIVCLLSIYLLIWTYNKFSTTNTNKKYFSKDFPMYGIAIFTIIMVIQSSLALSLGLVGALSIIRFRTAIKEPEQLIYLLMITGISIGTAAGQYRLVILSTIIFILMNALRSKKDISANNNMNMAVLMYPYDLEDKVNQILEEYTHNYSIKNRNDSSGRCTITLTGELIGFSELRRKILSLTDKNEIEINFYGND